MYIYHLHSYINDPKNFNGLIIRWLLEDDIYAENNNLDLLDLNYGMDSRHDLRSLIYPPDMNYRKWIEISKNYSKIILSLNFDIHSYKYKEFCKKILKYFPRNKNIIASACNECYEKRGTAEKVYQTALEVKQALDETGRNYPIAFWNEKIYTSGEKSAVEKLLNDQRVKDICKYFAFQSLGTTNYSVDKYAKIAKQKGFKRGDFESATKTNNFETLKNKFDLNRNLGIEDIVILTPVINKKLSDSYSIWGKYALVINDAPRGGIIKDKAKLIKYFQQFKTKGGEDMRLEKYYYKNRPDNLIKWDKQGYGIRFLRVCFGLFDSNIFDDALTNIVKDYQAANGLLIDGIVGPETFGNMIQVADYSKHYCWVHSLWARDM